MQQLYVVELECAPADPSSGPVEALLRRHLLDCWRAEHDGVPGEADLAADGFAVLPRRDEPDVWHDLRWSVAEGDGMRALRADLHEPIAGDARLLTRTTITTETDPATGATTTHLRVALGREKTSGQLAPALLPRLGRPALVGAVVGDPALRRTCAGQEVDGRLHVVRTVEQADDVVAFARDPRRLPLVLVHPRDQAGWGVARRAASELEGLARLVVVRGDAAGALAAGLPELPVPAGGARLLWPELDGYDHPAYAPEQVAAQDPPLATALFRTLAAVSVVARGRDDGWTRASRAAQRAEVERARSRVDAARRSGDRAAEVSALDDESAALRVQLDEWVAECAVLEEQLHSLTQEAETAKVLRYELDRSRARLTVLEAAADAAGTDWTAAPELDPRDAGPLFAFLEEASGGACVFTTRAARAWRKSGFAFPDKMREALVALAQAARDYAAHDGDVEDRLVEWMFNGYGLEVALTDASLELSKRARFTFEGADLDAVPHVKLGDAKRPTECGRIYFAWTAEPTRFVVDHVGLHR